MKPIDRYSLLAGMLVGGLSAALILGAVTWFRLKQDGPSRPQSQPAALREEQGSSDQSGVRASAPHPPGDSLSSGPLGRVELSEEEARAAGVETVEVRRRDLAGTLMAAGRVEEAETLLATISARVGGRVDKLYVDFTGQSVRKGQPIALIYSPEVVSTSEEYRLAVESLEGLGPGALPEAQAHARQLVDASRRRLELWGLTTEQIREVEKSSVTAVHITIHSPVSGTVTERKVTEGQYVREGDPLYSVSDLSAVWVKADVYESDLPLVRMGQTVEITSEALPGSRLRGQVSFIEPMLNPQTRTVPVRIQVPNPGLRLRPGMYARAMFRLAMGRAVLAVPRSAVIDTGMKTLVYVAKGKGVFEAREVKLGPAAEEFHSVLTGLQEGERIVTKGSFLIDSQTRLAGGLTALFGGSKQFSQEEGPRPNGGEYKIAFRTDPSPPKGGAENSFYVTVLDPQGVPVSEAEVSVEQVMPAMPAMGMPGVRSSAELKWNGREYMGKADVRSAGSWNVTVEVIRSGRTVATYRARFTAR